MDLKKLRAVRARSSASVGPRCPHLRPRCEAMIEVRSSGGPHPDSPGDAARALQRADGDAACALQTHANLTPLQAPVWQDLHKASQLAGRAFPLRGAPEDWPMDVHVRKILPIFCSQDEGARAATGLLVIGTTLGDEGPEIPVRMMENSVVLVLQNNSRGPKRYGYSQVPYVGGVPSTWEGAVDPLPQQAALEVVRALVTLGCRRCVAFVGISAGCHKVMALLAEQAKPLGSLALLPSVRVVLISGARYPELFL